MMEESDRAWDKIASRSYAFHSLRDECTHLRVLTLQQVCGQAMQACSGRAKGSQHAGWVRLQSSRHWPCFKAQATSTLPVLQVRDFYNTYLAPGSITRRKLSLHIMGQAHVAELEAQPPAGVQLVEQPQELSRQLPLWPAMLGDAHACN